MPRFFPLPTFNITVNIWRFPNFPFSPPDLQSEANLCMGRRFTEFQLEGGSTDNEICMWLLLPIGTDIRGEDVTETGTPGDVVEAPAWSGRTYQVVSVDDAGGAFPNEHRVAILEKLTPWPVPIPTVKGPYFPPPPPPPPPGFLGVFSTGGVPANSIPFSFTLLAPGKVVLFASWWANPTVPTLAGVGAMVAGSNVQYVDAFAVDVGCFIGSSPVLPAGVNVGTLTFPVGIGYLFLSIYTLTYPLGIQNQVNTSVNMLGAPPCAYLASPVPLPAVGMGVLTSASGAPVVSCAPPWVLLADFAEPGTFPLIHRQEVAYLLQTVAGNPSLIFTVPGILSGCESISSFA